MPTLRHKEETSNTPQKKSLPVSAARINGNRENQREDSTLEMLETLGDCSKLAFHAKQQNVRDTFFFSLTLEIAETGI